MRCIKYAPLIMQDSRLSRLREKETSNCTCVVSRCMSAVHRTPEYSWRIPVCAQVGCIYSFSAQKQKTTTEMLCRLRHTCCFHGRLRDADRKNEPAKQTGVSHPSPQALGLLLCGKALADMSKARQVTCNSSPQSRCASARCRKAAATAQTIS